jgi:hypothetical protein
VPPPEEMGAELNPRSDFVKGQGTIAAAQYFKRLHGFAHWVRKFLVFLLPAPAVFCGGVSAASLQREFPLRLR